jgi:hypothetical protein
MRGDLKWQYQHGFGHIDVVIHGVDVSSNLDTAQHQCNLLANLDVAVP